MRISDWSSDVCSSDLAERALHAALLRNPREAVSKERLAAIADPDAIENYRVVLGFRDRLLDAATLEDAYLGLFLDPDGVRVPPLFVDQLAHVIARALLEEIGRASCRERVCHYVYISVVAVHLKKKSKKKDTIIQ